MPLIKIQPSSLNVSATYTVAGVIANGVNIGPTLVNAYDTANLAFDKANTGGGGSAIAILDEGIYLTNAVSSINFVGSAVTASNVGNTVTVTITGGGGSSLTTSIVTGTTQTAVKDTQYVLANTFATTVTLPSTPILGDTLYIVVANNLSNNVIDRNGTKLMGIDENMTIDIANTAIGLVYVNTTLGWRLI